MIDIVLGAGWAVFGIYWFYASNEIARHKLNRDFWKNQAEEYATSYATERRKRLEAEQALTDMEAQKDRIHDLLTAVSSESNACLVRLERIAAIPNNGKKPNGGLLKAQRIAGAV